MGTNSRDTGPHLFPHPSTSTDPHSLFPRTHRDVAQPDSSRGWVSRVGQTQRVAGEGLMEGLIGMGRGSKAQTRVWLG